MFSPGQGHSDNIINHLEWFYCTIARRPKLPMDVMSSLMHCGPLLSRMTCIDWIICEAFRLLHGMLWMRFIFNSNIRSSRTRVEAWCALNVYLTHCAAQPSVWGEGPGSNNPAQGKCSSHRIIGPRRGGLIRSILNSNWIRGPTILWHKNFLPNTLDSKFDEQNNLDS